MNDEYRRHRGRLLFETPPGDFARVAEATRRVFADEYPAASPERQAQIVDLLGDLTIDLRSYLARWHLLARHDDGILDEGVVRVGGRIGTTTCSADGEPTGRSRRSTRRSHRSPPATCDGSPS